MKHNKEKIREKHNDLFDYSLDIIFIHDLEGNFLDANDMALETFGYEKKEIQNLSFINLISKDQLGNAFKIIKEIKDTGKQSKRHEFNAKTKEGKIISIETYGFPLKKKEKIYAILVIGHDITKNKLAEQKLKESEEKFRNIADQSLLGIAIIQDYKIKYLNKKWAENFGYTIEELKNWKPKEFIKSIYPEDRALVMEQARKKQFGLSGFLNQYQFRAIKKSGEIVWFNNFGKTISYKGSPASLNVIIDITKEKEAEQKIRNSEEKFRNITDQFLMGICILQDNVIKYVNKRFADIIGYTVEELMNWQPNEFINAIYPEDRRIVVEQAMKKQSGNKDIIVHYPFRGVKKTGETVWVDNYAKAIIFEGRPADLITVIDITERMRAQKNLKESEKKYRDLFENLPFSIFLFDSNGIIVDCNPVTEEILGYKKEELIGRHFKNASVIHPKYLQKAVELFEEFLKGRKLKRVNFELYKKDGSLIWANMQSSLVKIGNKTFVQSIFSDITKNKKAEFLVNEEIKKLKELDKIRKELIIRISHNLKTPLVPVCGGSELLLDRYTDQFGKEIKEIITLIKKGGERLNQLIDKLIDVSRLEYGMFALEKQMYDLSEIIKECCDDMKYQIKEREISLDLDLPNNLYINIDSIRIAEVVANLLSNAIKNSPPKGKITINLQKKGNWAKITVSDTGIGLNKDEMKRIFTRFGKIERYEKGLEYIDITGSGLGLFISKEIVELHGGKIWAESPGRNKGSKFTVEIPIS